MYKRICDNILCINKHRAKGLCVKHYKEKWKDINKHKVAKWNKIYSDKNKEKIKIYQKEYQKEWRKRNPEKRLETNIKLLNKLGKSFNMNSSEYNWALISWSKTIKKLDNNICKLCDSKENLHAHHIQPKALFPKISLDLNNGITLCMKCHESVHGYNFKTLHAMLKSYIHLIH